jgi:hypothetical protein
VGEDVVLGLWKMTVVCVILAVVKSVEEIDVEGAAVEEIEVVVTHIVVVLGVVVDGRSVVLVVETVVRLVVRLVVTRGVVVIILEVVEEGVTVLVLRAFTVTGTERA